MLELGTVKPAVDVAHAITKIPLAIVAPAVGLLMVQLIEDVVKCLLTLDLVPLCFNKIHSLITHHRWRKSAVRMATRRQSQTEASSSCLLLN